MLDLSQIATYYPPALQPFRRFILREYLQHKLLQLIYESSYADRFTFLGGTCLRIVHGNQRFSEDLDFDNTGITEADFDALSRVVEAGLEREGYQVEMRLVMKGAYHCHIKFPALLFQQGLSGYEQEKILIQLDTDRIAEATAALYLHPGAVSAQPLRCVHPTSDHPAGFATGSEILCNFESGAQQGS